MITARVTAEEHASVNERAARARMSLSRYLVACGLRGKPPPLQTTLPLTGPARQEREMLLFRLSRIETNINQMAARMNRAKWTGATWKGAAPPTGREMEEASRELLRLVHALRHELFVRRYRE
jgi:hypothetical protein